MDYRRDEHDFRFGLTLFSTLQRNKVTSPSLQPIQKTSLQEILQVMGHKTEKTAHVYV